MKFCRFRKLRLFIVNNNKEVKTFQNQMANEKLSNNSNEAFQKFEELGRLTFKRLCDDLSKDTSKLEFTPNDYDPYDATYDGYQIEIKYQQQEDRQRDHTLIPAYKAETMLSTSDKNILVTILDSGDTIYFDYFSGIPEHLCYINYTQTTCGDDTRKYDKRSYYFYKSESTCYRLTEEGYRKSEERPRYRYYGPTKPIS